MLTLSDLSWTGTRWEIRTANGFVDLDDLLNKIDVLEIKGAMYHYQQAAEAYLDSEISGLRGKLAEKEIEIRIIRVAANQYKEKVECLERQRNNFQVRAQEAQVERDCAREERDAAITYMRKSNWCAGCVNFLGLGGCADSLMEVCDKDHDHYQFCSPQEDDCNDE